jgi:phosphohistidine swiveling domain-containing protein
LKDASQPADRVLLVPGASRPDVSGLSRSRAIVTVYGGMLSHIAIACRELGVPCVAGLGATIPDGTSVEVDGDLGTVTPTAAVKARAPSMPRRLAPSPVRAHGGDHREVISDSLWLYDLSTQSDGDAFVHLPLVYATHMSVQHEAYAQAMLRFAQLIDRNQSLRGSIVDEVVFRFDAAGYRTFRDRCLAKIGLNRRFAGRLGERSISVRRRLPAACIRAERSFASTGDVSGSMLTRLFDLVVAAIMVNLANPFVESAIVLARELFGDRADFDSLYQDIVLRPSFSHMSYFDSELGRLRKLARESLVTREDIERFAWVAGFLGPDGRDRSAFESGKYVAKQIGSPHTLSGPDKRAPSTAYVSAPEVPMDPTGLTEEWSDEENQLMRLLMLMRNLQVSEESRHYWQARAMRLFRLLAGPDLAAETRLLADYKAI